MLFYVRAITLLFHVNTKVSSSVTRSISAAHDIDMISAEDACFFVSMGKNCLFL